MKTLQNDLARQEQALIEMTANAQFLARETARFTATHPPAAANEAPMPRFTWNQLERQLLDLAENKTLARFLRGSLASCAQQADRLPPELLLREILILAAMAQEEPSPATEGDSSMA